MSSDVKGTTELSESRRALLERYLSGAKTATESKPVTIPKRNETDPAPLSFSQQQIFVHSQLAGSALIYNEPVTIRHHGELNVPALERSLREIIRRHEAWRTTFEWKGEHAVQVVQPPPKRIEVPSIDLRDLRIRSAKTSRNGLQLRMRVCPSTLPAAQCIASALSEWAMPITGSI